MILTIGLAIKMIALYTAGLNKFTALLAKAQARLQAVAVVPGTSEATIRALSEEVSRWQTIVGLLKEWIEEWKNVIKDFRAMLKSLAELGRPAQ